MPADSPATARVTHRFAAPAERVFDAWLDPELIGSWMFGLAGDREEIVRISVDPRVGGAFSFAVRRDGQEIDHIGEYLAIDRPRHLAFTWGVRGESDGESRVLIDIEPLAAGCEVTLRHEMAPQWADFTERAAGSWSMMLDTLAKWLRETADGIDES